MFKLFFLVGLFMIGMFPAAAQYTYYRPCTYERGCGLRDRHVMPNINIYPSREYERSRSREVLRDHPRLSHGLLSVPGRVVDSILGLK